MGEFVTGEAFRAPSPEDIEPEITGRDERYREQLREAEAERDRLRGLVEAGQRAEVERLAAARLTDARDLWYRDTSVADMLDDDGHVDPSKLDAAVDSLLAEHSHWAAPARAHRGELRSGASERPIAPMAPSWRDAFAPSVESRVP